MTDPTWIDPEALLEDALALRAQMNEMEAFSALLTLMALTGMTAQREAQRGAIFAMASHWLEAKDAKLATVPNMAELATKTAESVRGVLERWPKLDADEPDRVPTRWQELRLMGLGLADMARDLEGVLGADAILAAVLEALGDAKGAKTVREKQGGERWRRWISTHQPGGGTIEIMEQPGGGRLVTNPMPPAVIAVFRAAWARIEAERERARLARGVIRRGALGALQHSVRVGPNRPTLVEVAGSVPALQLERKVNVATVPTALVHGLAPERLEAAMRGGGLIATTGWNALVHKAVVGSSRRQWDGEQHPGLYRFAGYAGMAEALGLSKPKHRVALPDMLEFGELYQFDLGDGFKPAALWTHRTEKTSGAGQGKRLEWNVNPWVYGADVHASPNHADKTLVFLSPQPAPMVAKASPNLSPAQWAFWWQFHPALVALRAELFDTGAMTLPASWWEAVAEEAGWTAKQKRDLLPKTIDRYTADLVDQLLERVPGKTWVFKPGRSLEGVADGLKRQEARFRGNSKGGKSRAAKREARMVSGWKPTPKRKPKT